MQLAVSHTNTDFDALASQVAATILYPGAKALLPRRANPNVQTFLSIHKSSMDFLEPGDLKTESVERLIVCDVNVWRRIEAPDSLKQRDGMEIHLWDHHMNPGDITADKQMVSPSGACVSLMVGEMRKQNITLSPIQATLFLLGIYDDTGHLTYPSTTAEDAHSVGWLLEQGADLAFSRSYLNPAFTDAQRTVLFSLMDAADIMELDGVKIGFAHVELTHHVETLAALLHTLSQLLNLDAAFAAFTLKNGTIMLSGRSGAAHINVAALMKRFGGGGHPGAGSAILKKGRGDACAALERLKEVIRVSCHEDVTASDLMSFPVVSISGDTPMRSVSAVMSINNVGGVPVMEDDKMTGLVTRDEIRKLRLDKHWEMPVKAFMKRDTPTLTPSDSPTHAARLIFENDIGHLPVLEDEKLVGVVSRSDILTYFYDLLPE